MQSLMPSRFQFHYRFTLVHFLIRAHIAAIAQFQSTQLKINYLLINEFFRLL